MAAQLGQPVLGATPSGFECSAPAGKTFACRPKSNDAKLRVMNLQAALNAVIDGAKARVSTNLEHLRLVVDGAVGPRTTSAVGTLGTMALKEIAEPSISDLARTAIASATPENVAAAASDLTVFFRQVSAALGIVLQPITQVSSDGTAPANQTSTAIVPASQIQPQGRKGLHWGWWVGGLVFLAGAGFLGWKMFGGKSKGRRAFRGADDDDYTDAQEVDPSDFGYQPAGDDFIDV